MVTSNKIASTQSTSFKPQPQFGLNRTSEPQINTARADISVIIVNYNVREFLRQCLLSLRPALEPLAAEIFVVDNASNDGSVEMVQREFPEVQLVANRENAGFARANNQALQQATGRFVVLLNPDTVVQEDTFTAIATFFDKHPETGMVGCKVLNPDGTLQLACRRSFPTPWVAFTRLSGLSQLFPKSRWFGRYNLTYLPEGEIAEVEAISGSFMAVRREALAQVGWLDEDFFLYGEDLDWCFRLRQAGWKIHYFPGTQIVHFKGESAKQSDLDNLRLFYQAMGQFVRKHFRPDSPSNFYKGKSWWRVAYWLLHLAIWIRALLAFAESLSRKLAAPLLDLTLMQLSMAVAVWLRFESWEVLPRFLIVDAVYSFIWLSCLALFGCYRQSRYSFYQAFAAVAFGFFINASLTYFFKQYAFSRAVVLVAGVMNMLLLASWRFLVKVFSSPFIFSKGKPRRTVVVGDFAADETLLEKLKNRRDDNYELVGLVSLNHNEIGKYYAGLPVLTSLDHLEEWLATAHSAWTVGENQSSQLSFKKSKEKSGIQQVIFSTPRIPFGRMLEVMSLAGGAELLSFKLAPSHVDVIIGMPQRWNGLDQVAEVPLLEIENRLAQFWPALGKRVLDVTLAGIFLLLGAPFFLLLWLLRGKLHALDIHAGPAVTNNQTKSPQLGFTTARGKSRLRLWQLSHNSFERNKGLSGLAKWPWLFAILAGKLSWVGVAIPSAGFSLKEQAGKPGQAPSKKDEYGDARPLPLALPPAVTDLAKISRRGQLSPEEKDKLYLYYVTHYTPLLDMEILLRTIFRIK